ncbi:DUF6438 domain-containing protein [Algoriphagus sp. NG3]|uniref:DUF6438 domain-containing protein n=1 Tax=Algoriphagus sp. NG3 TaxID=3097546 RepID=UPI002A815C70|nr:DUF6438 domain-containing protein [Algoriphagus sp. NG3]WPR73555.1 DUF6438 domain-containing protein [Algoriphagus sp. NG3]
MLKILLLAFTLISQVGFAKVNEGINDRSLLSAPYFQKSEHFFESNEALGIVDQKLAQDSSFNFNKLIFHSTACYGSCPVIHMELSADRSLKYSGDYFEDAAFQEVDSAVRETLEGSFLKVSMQN